jgi:fatty acid desaturase
MNESKIVGKPQPHSAEWKRIVVQYQQPSAARASWQIVNTLVPYALLWVVMYHTLAISWWLTGPLAILAGAFLVRVFIIFQLRPTGRWILPKSVEILKESSAD